MKNDRTYLGHIAEAIEKIERYLTSISFYDFIVDPMRVDAVTRELEIIGEASRHLSDDFKKTHQEIPFDDIVGMRNLLIHGYYEVDLAVVWKTCHEDLPALRKMIASVLQE
jgi:uncharacterized protein with HEPN domain